MDLSSTSPNPQPLSSSSPSTSPAQSEEFRAKRKREKSEETSGSTEISSRSVEKRTRRSLTFGQEILSTQEPATERRAIESRIVKALGKSDLIEVGLYVKILGKGKHNTVKIHTQTTTPEKRDRAIKKDHEGYTTEDPNLIMIRLNPQWNTQHTRYTTNIIGRNIFAYRLNVLLGMHLVVESRPGTLKGKLVLAMKKAKGESPTGHKWMLIDDPSLREKLESNIQQKQITLEGQHVNKIGYPIFRETGFWLTTYDSEKQLWGCFRTVSPKVNFEDPLLRKQLSQLSIHHYLTRMIDGHFGNMLMEFGPENQFRGLKSFDYDFSSVEGEVSLEETKKLPWTYFSGLPRVIDRETLKTIHQLTAKDIIECCQDTQLSKDEEQTHVSALEFLKEHYAYDRAGTDFHIMDNDSEWGSKQVAKLLYEGPGYFADLVKCHVNEHGKLPPPLENEYPQKNVVVQEKRPAFVAEEDLVATIPAEEYKESLADIEEDLPDTFSASRYAEAFEANVE